MFTDVDQLRHLTRNCNIHSLRHITFERLIGFILRYHNISNENRKASGENNYEDTNMIMLCNICLSFYCKLSLENLNTIEDNS